MKWFLSVFLFINNSYALESNQVYIDTEPAFFEREDHNENIVLRSIAGNSEEFVYYEVQKHDTLMLIAFELYSSYSKWRDIFKDNATALNGSTDLSKVRNLRIRKPLNPRVYPKGLPYRIKKDDSLSKISRDVYGRMKYWPVIYENNRDQIPNPDLIFAGFLLFYPKSPYSTPLLD